VNVKIIDNTKTALSQHEINMLRALYGIGIKNQEIVTKVITSVGAVDTGRLRSSMTYEVHSESQSVTVGTDVEYAIYVHEGTSRMRGRPYLMDSILHFIKEYEEIAVKYLGDGFKALDYSGMDIGGAGLSSSMIKPDISLR